ncbi:GNAT family N-acetyltransferase [Thalassotalea marina]
MPTVLEYKQLRALVGWTDVDSNMVNIALKNSLFHVTARYDATLIGMARVIGDGAMFFYVQDLVVHPDFQNLGIGHKLMEHIEQYLAQNTKQGATIGLLSAQGKESFYLRYGYMKRSGDPWGLGMCKFI